MKRIVIVLVIVISIISGCRPDGKNATLTPNPTPSITPRWEMYETALLKATIGKDDGVCEWTIMGISHNEIYVYVDCKSSGQIRTAMSGPAVIYLGRNGEIEKVTVPRDGKNYPKDILALFPSDIQDKIFSHDVGNSLDLTHLEQRIINGGPPLIIVLGTPMP